MTCGGIIPVTVVTIAAIAGVILVLALTTIIAALLTGMIGIVITWGFHVIFA